MLACALVLRATGTVGAAVLADDYTMLVAKRVELEYQVRVFDDRFSAARKRQAELDVRFVTCRNQAWRVYWVPNLRRAEQVRLALEGKRVSLEALRADAERVRVRLEKRRREIEDRYHDQGRGEAYEREFRAYMDEFERSYLRAVAMGVFSGYRAYLSGARAYAAFVERSVTCCEARDFTSVAVDATDAAIARIARATETMVASLHGDFSP